MFSRIEKIQDKILVGQNLKMSLANNKTPQLWKGFMQQRKEILNAANTNLYSIQVYDPSLNFKNFSPQVIFTKWAAVQVTEHTTTPKGMMPYILKGGTYAVFIHRGKATAFHRTMEYIFGVWLPKSGYVLDKRPHFEVLGEKYRNDSEDSEEEVWIPIKTIN